MPAQKFELRLKIAGAFNHADSLLQLRSHWDMVDGKPSTYPPTAHTHPISDVTNLQTTLNGKLDISSTSYVKHDDVLMPTNSFGGRKLFINSIDNAMYAADKKWVVVVTRHLKSYGGQTYPMLNPDYVGEYTITGSGTTRTISNTPKPSNIVVYENDVLKLLTTHYTYNSSTGVITFNYTPSGTIYVYGGAEIPQYLDSPVDATFTDGQVANLFDGSYESWISTTNENYYVKVRITPNASNYGSFDFTYKYGSFYLSYYYLGTPEKAEYRVYNYSFRPHGVGWKKQDLTDYIGNNSTAAHIQAVSDGVNHGRSIMEFIIYGKPVTGGYATALTQIDWKLSRPDLSKTGSTVTKYGINKLYYNLVFGDRTSDKVVISPAGTIKINNLDIYHPGNKPSLSDLGINDLISTSESFSTGDILGRKSLGNGALEKISWSEWRAMMLGESSDTAYRGDRGKIAYDHSQTTHAPTDAQKNSDITKTEIEAKLTGQITSHTHESVPKIVETRASALTQIWTGSQAQYDAIGTKDSNTLYFIQA